MFSQLNPLRVPALLAAAAGAALAPSAVGDVVASVNLSTIPSYKLAGNPNNTTVSVNVPGTGNAYRLLISGRLDRINAGALPRDSCIRVRRIAHLGAGLNLLTHEFIAQPFTGYSWAGGATGGFVDVSGALVLPVPQNNTFNNGFSFCAMNEPCHYEFEFFQQYDYTPADSSFVPDTSWQELTIAFDNTPPSLDTPAPVSGTVGVTTRYGVRSNDTLDPGAFTGTQIDPLAQPANAARIRHARITGYINAKALSTPTEYVGNNQCGQARLRLRRSESVLLSPNDPAPYSTDDDVTVDLPADIGSTGFVSIDLPIAANNPFGKLTRNVPTGANESYNGIRYYATAYESVDHLASAIDSIWNGLKIELFSAPQPSPAADLGVLAAAPSFPDSGLSRLGTIPAGRPLWFRFELPGPVSDALGTYLDIDTEGTWPVFDTMIGLYSGNAADAGVRVGFDDDDGSGQFSQLSFGDAGPRPATGNGQPRNGRDGPLAAGVYYLAVAPYVTGTGTAAMGTADCNVTNPDTVDHPVRVNLYYNTLAPCGPADLAGQGGAVGADGRLDNNDFVVFIDMFFNHVAAADLGSQGGVAGADGAFDNNDFVVFIDRFFAGC